MHFQQWIRSAYQLDLKQEVVFVNNTLLQKYVRSV